MIRQRLRTRTAASVATIVWLVACGESKEAATSGEDSDTVVATAPAIAAPDSSMPADSSLSAFWDRFREAVARRDTAAIVALTDRGFQTRGEMDGDPWIPRDSAGVAALVDSLMSADPGLGRESTMRALVAATPVVDSSRFIGTGEFRLGSLVFEMRGGAWKLTKAYWP
jgi:hypothetical protein